MGCRRGGLETLDYAFPPGKESFRRQIAQRMASLGVPISPDDVLATNGAQEAIILALRAVTQPGDIVAVESPSFPGILQALEVVGGLRVIEIPTHPSDGISLEGGLQLALEQWPLKACVVVPNHSNPMGARMTDERKQQLVAMLAAANVPLIEDDIYGDLYHTGERPRPAKAFDRADNVIHCSSFSKTISPGLRLGWMIPPGRHMASARQHKYFVNLATSSIPQLAVAHFLEQVVTIVIYALPANTTVRRPNGCVRPWPGRSRRHGGQPATGWVCALGAAAGRCVRY